jgi:hypothetical protein
MKMSLLVRIVNYRTANACLFRNWSEFGVTKAMKRLRDAVRLSADNIDAPK